MTRCQSRCPRLSLILAAILIICPAPDRVSQAEEDAVPLPREVRAVWDLNKASRETTPTRERVCINGLWRWQPAETRGPNQYPPATGATSRFPGCWPGITDYLQKDWQTRLRAPQLEEHTAAQPSAAWYQREITVPGHWTGRRIALSVEYLNSHGDGLRGRQAGGRDPVSGRRAGPHLALPPGSSIGSACSSWPRR